MEAKEEGYSRKKRWKGFSFGTFLREKCPFLFDIRSLFYFFWLLFVLGLLWMAYGLLTNSFTQFYPWTDYFGQYVTMAYDFHDTWRTFFKTGYFELYSPSTYLGSDNIGSNSYYGLFDPFLFFCYLFPKSAIPQTFAIATVLKGVAGGFAMRAYLKYLGVSERSARLGALAFAFNGYINFFVGFPSFVSMAFTVPLVLLGIEKVLSEKRINVLTISLALLGMISFFFLVVVCIFGVLYAVFRYLQTIQKRKGFDNLYVILFGVLGFALGILMSAWTLFPSLRQSALSGRTTSIGKAYLDSLLLSFKNLDVKTTFTLLFEPVGRHSARELQALIGFFYPTIGYRYSPLMGGGYDAWTASLFCYTPFVLLSFVALVSSCREKKISHVVVWLLIGYMLFTDFSYYFFYAFTGDGYGRWYIVLIPIIIYYGAQELDKLKREPKWLVLTGEGLAVLLTALTWAFVVLFVRNETFEPRLDGYWQNDYKVPYTYSYDGVSRSFLWVILLQIGFLLLQGILILAWQKKAVLKKALMGFVMVETILWGNVSFIDNTPWRVDDLTNSKGQVIGNGWNGGNAYRETTMAGMDAINEEDPSYFRTFFEGNPENNAAMSFGSNGTSTFHSLFNYDVNQLSLYLHANRATYRNTTYAYGEDYYSHSWSAFYGNKRFGGDTALGMKYYAILNQGYGELEGIADNVPWDSTLVYGDKDSKLRFYRNAQMDRLPLGHAVDKVYKQNAVDPLCGYDDFFEGGGEREALRNDEVLFDSVIVQDEDVDSFLSDMGDSFSFLSRPSESALYEKVSYQKKCYKMDYDWWGPLDENGKRAGPSYFLIDDRKTSRNISFGGKYIPDTEVVVFTPSGSTYFNDDPSGGYFAINYAYNNSLPSSAKTRIYMIGDTESETDVLLSYEYETIATYMRRKASSGSDAVFGFYPKGKVKYICFCAKSSDFSGNNKTAVVTLPNTISVYKAERSDIESRLSLFESDAYNLQDVTYDKNRFEFHTSFPSKKAVVTTLGYDAGWKLEMKGEEGSEDIKVYKFNGGFVGFVLPEGEHSYVLRYVTPYLKEGALAASIAIFVFGITEIAAFCIAVSKKKKSLQN